MEQSIVDKIKNTVGYSETENKKIFMDGANVGYAKAQEMYLKRIELLERSAHDWEQAYNVAANDIRTVSKIISDYSPENL